MTPPPRRIHEGGFDGPGPRRGPLFRFRAGPGGPAPGLAGLRAPGGPGRGPLWRLSLSYTAGPVDALVTGLRRRNIALGFSILALLGGAITALTVAVRRAQSLAGRQRQFMASISHELRTPLAVIGSAAENLRDGTVDDGARVREYGQMIHAESRGRWTSMSPPSGRSWRTTRAPRST